MKMTHNHVVVLVVTMVALVGLASILINPSRHEHVFFGETLCDDPSMMPVLTQQTDFGSGKMVISACVPQGTVISSYGARFPSLRQRWKTPGSKISY